MRLAVGVAAAIRTGERATSLNFVSLNGGYILGFGAGKRRLVKVRIFCIPALFSEIALQIFVNKFSSVAGINLVARYL